MSELSLQSSLQTPSSSGGHAMCGLRERYSGTSLIRNSVPLKPYCRPIPRSLGGS